MKSIERIVKERKRQREERKRRKAENEFLKQKNDKDETRKNSEFKRLFVQNI